MTKQIRMTVEASNVGELNDLADKRIVSLSLFESLDSSSSNNDDLTVVVISVKQLRELILSK